MGEGMKVESTLLTLNKVEVRFDAFDALSRLTEYGQQRESFGAKAPRSVDLAEGHFSGTISKVSLV